MTSISTKKGEEEISGFSIDEEGRYTITNITEDTTLEGIPADKRTGTFTTGQTVEIATTPTGDRSKQ